jgi:beta-glucosidase/6-phospho-beta-glucosidase/beta-galactosidase
MSVLLLLLCRFHWDLPQVLQDKYKGFLDPQIQDDFVYYADAVFANLGDLVDQWMTFNEVISICELGYERDTFAPGVSALVCPRVGGAAEAASGEGWRSGQ